MKLSAEMISAYADGELQGSEKIEFEKNLQSDAEAQQKLQDILLLKQTLQGAYRAVSTPADSHKGKLNYRVAAYLGLLLLAFSGGWISSDLTHPPETYKLADTHDIKPALKVVAANPDPGKYILHIGSRDQKKFKAALDKAESLVAMYHDADHPYQIEVIANAGGVDLLRDGETPYSDRIRQLSRDYPNIKFIACSNAIERLQEKGISANLITSVHTGPTALDQVVKRMNQGWTYMKI